MFWLLFARFEAEGIVSSFQDVAVVCDAIEESGCHFGVAEDADPFREGEVGGENQRGVDSTFGTNTRTGRPVRRFMTFESDQVSYFNDSERQERRRYQARPKKAKTPCECKQADV